MKVPLTEAEAEERAAVLQNTDTPVQSQDGKDKTQPIKPGRDLIEGPEVYARLPLLAPLTLTNGGIAKEVIVYRPTCGMMTQILDTVSTSVQVERFVDACCRAVNGSGEEKFSVREMNCIDSSEFSSIINSMSMDSDAVLVDESGDGITSPLFYTLKRPIKITPQIPNSEVCEQFAFEARKMGDISEYLDARGETREFHTFMRVFGKPIGIRIPIMTDILIGAIDFLDYLVIRRQIVPKFTVSRNRWKRQSSPEPSPITGHPARGMN